MTYWSRFAAAYGTVWLVLTGAALVQIRLHLELPAVVVIVLGCAIYALVRHSASARPPSTTAQPAPLPPAVARPSEPPR